MVALIFLGQFLVFIGAINFCRNITVEGHATWYRLACGLWYLLMVEIGATFIGLGVRSCL